MTDPRSEFPFEHEEPDEAADEQFAHGLLEFLAKDDRNKQKRRLAAVMGRIDPQAASSWGARESWGLRLKVGITAVAGVAVVAAVLWLMPKRGEAAEALAALHATKSGGALFQCEFGVQGEEWLTGSFEVGDKGQRHVLLYTPDHPLLTKELLRTAKGVCLQSSLAARRQVTVEQYRGSWPTWFRYGGLVGPLRSPRDWLAVLTATHELSWAGEDRIVGARRSPDVLGPIEEYELLPERFEVRFDLAQEGRIEQLDLAWASSDQSSPRRERSMVELYEAPPQVDLSMRLPTKLRFERAPTPKRPAWWFTKERFQRQK